MAVIDNLKDIVFKNGVSDAFIVAENGTATVQIQMPGVGADSFIGKGKKPTTVIATLYNSEGYQGCCTVSEITTGTFTVIVKNNSAETWYAVHWMAIWN